MLLGVERVAGGVQERANDQVLLPPAAAREINRSMKRTLAANIVAASLLVFVGGCGDDDNSNNNNNDPGLPNPAAVFCEEQGGTTSGPEPMCNLPDGSVVDAWEYYRTEGP